MKPSHLSTPRTLADCTFDTGYPIAHTDHYYRFSWESVAGYILTGIIGASMAVLFVVGIWK